MPSGSGATAASAGPNPADPAIAALERAEEALAEAETLLTRLAAEADADPRHLEQAEERLFALRAAARKHGVAVPDLPALFDTLSARLAALVTGAAEVVAMEAAAIAARDAYLAAAADLSAARSAAAAKLQKAVSRELPPLRLDKARFFVEVERAAEAAWGPGGMDQVHFLIAANPGQPPGPLARVASGGELSRLMLAMKVVLSAGSAVPTLVFDEVELGHRWRDRRGGGRAVGARRGASAGAGRHAQPAGRRTWIIASARGEANRPRSHGDAGRSA